MQDYVKSYIERIEPFARTKGNPIELLLIGGLAMSFYGSPILNANELSMVSPEFRMSYYVYENWTAEHKTIIPICSCGNCNEGRGWLENP